MEPAKNSRWIARALQGALAVALPACDGQVVSAPRGAATGATTTTSTGDGGATTTGSSTTTTGQAGGTSTASSGGAGGATSSSSSSGGGGPGGQGGSGGQPAPIDLDGDGWTTADGDCCDDPGSFCAVEPALVNPGAFEYLGNDIDDDCDPSTSDDFPPPDCSGSPLQAPTTAIDLIEAMDLCNFTSDNVPLADKKWGVLDAALVMADGSQPAPADIQAGVLASFGPNVLPMKGPSFAALSTGTARAEGDPGYVHPQDGPTAADVGGFDADTQAALPPTWLALNGGSMPPSANCPACTGPSCLTAFDSANLRMHVRVPTNALAFSYAFKFYTAEYPERGCTEHDDFFLALLTSSEPSLPFVTPDTNVAFDPLLNPVSADHARLDVCFPSGASTCPQGQLELVGNGMGGWNGGFHDGAGTPWLINYAPVLPGETIILEFVVWDGGDHDVDSIVLLDRFKWSVTPYPWCCGE